MRNIEKELKKLDSVDIKKQNPHIQAIEAKEQIWIEDINNNLDKIFSSKLLPIIEALSKTPNIENLKTRKIFIEIPTLDENGKPKLNDNGEQLKEIKEFTIPVNIIQDFHKSYIEDDELRDYFETQLMMWFSDKTEYIRAKTKTIDSFKDIMDRRVDAFALAILAISAFHEKPHMVLRKAQIRTGLAISEGNIAELASGEGKTLATVLPAFLFALTGKGVHIMTANSYLSKRDFDELRPIYEGLGVTVGYSPENEIEYATITGEDISNYDIKEKYNFFSKYLVDKKLAYRMSITYGSVQTFAFDYLNDNSIQRLEDMVQGISSPGFAIVDEIDAVLVDDAKTPYIVSIPTPMYERNMSLNNLCLMLKISYDEVFEKVKEIVKNPDRLTYEEARYISLTYGNCELLESSDEYQRIADEFVIDKKTKIFDARDGEYEKYKTAEEVFRAIRDGDIYEPGDKKYDPNDIRSKYDIIYCDRLKKFIISDRGYQEYLRKCYLRLKINTFVVGKEKKIIDDKRYVKNVDYILDGDRLRLTRRGAKRIIGDRNYPEFIEDYTKYTDLASLSSIATLHYLNQAIIAHLFMNKGEEYVVKDGKIKVLKDGRIQEQSKFSYGLHQAIEEKEKIAMDKRTKGSMASSTITQLDFLLRYSMFSGMTGTSAKDIFERVFKKNTVEIPRAVVEEKSANELLGVDKKDIKFSLDNEKKFNLILRSVEDSLSSSHKRKQPVLIVASNPDEVDKLVELFETRHIKATSLKALTDKELEGFIISKAGIPGSVLVTTRMCGRGTDIILGGDREKGLNFLCKRALGLKDKLMQNFSEEMKKFSPKKIKKYVEKHLREIVELTAMQSGELHSEEQEKQWKKDLEKIGLKVISCGGFELSRIDRQLEGRTGRNGVSGEYERFYSISDIKRMGISHIGKVPVDEYFAKFKENAMGDLDIDKESYEKEIIPSIRHNHEQNEIRLRNDIEKSQQLNNYSTKLIEKLRDLRRRIISKQADSNQMMKSMIREVTDAIISSYVLDDNINEISLTEPLMNKTINVDVEGISLEVKKTLGVTFDYNVVEKSKLNLLELRDLIVRTAEIRRKDLVNGETERKTLLEQNDYMLSGVREVLERCFTVRNVTILSNGQVDATTNIEFGATRRKLLYESYKYALRPVMGIALSFEENEKLEKKREQLYGFSKIEKKIEEDKDEYIESPYEENNLSIVDKLKRIKKIIDKEDAREYHEIERQIEKSNESKEPIDLHKLYANLYVKPWKLLDGMIDGVELVSFNVRKEEISEGELNMKPVEKGVIKLLQRFKTPKITNNEQEKEEREAS